MRVPVGAVVGEVLLSAEPVSALAAQRVPHERSRSGSGAGPLSGDAGRGAEQYMHRCKWWGFGREHWGHEMGIRPSARSP